MYVPVCRPIKEGRKKDIVFLQEKWKCDDRIYLEIWNQKKNQSAISIYKIFRTEKANANERKNSIL